MEARGLTHSRSNGRSRFQGIALISEQQILGLCRASAYRFAASGDLPTRRLGGRVYVVTSRLASFINGDGEAA